MKTPKEIILEELKAQQALIFREIAELQNQESVLRGKLDILHVLESRIFNGLVDLGAWQGPTGEIKQEPWVKEVQELCQVMNKRLDAIKLLRQQTGWTLKEAKDYIDREFPRSVPVG